MPAITHQQQFYHDGGPLVIFAAITSGSVTVEALTDGGSWVAIADPITAASSASPIHLPVPRQMRCSVSGTVTTLERWVP